MEQLNLFDVSKTLCRVGQLGQVKALVPVHPAKNLGGVTYRPYKIGDIKDYYLSHCWHTNIRSGVY